VEEKGRGKEGEPMKQLLALLTAAGIVIFSCTYIAVTLLLGFQAAGELRMFLAQ
jgi:hypothetical protein